MKTPEPTPIKAVEMVRRIRDAHAVLLEGKSNAERFAFYNEKGSAAHAELALLAEKNAGVASPAV